MKNQYLAMAAKLSAAAKSCSHITWQLLATAACAAGFLLLPLSATAKPTTLVPDEARYRALVKIIHKNLGFAHFTRGINVCTVLATREAVTSSDIPILVAMLHDDDRLVSATAAKTMAAMGDAGTGALTEERTAARSEVRYVIDDAIAGARDLNPALDRYRKSLECGRRR